MADGFGRHAAGMSDHATVAMPIATPLGADDDAFFRAIALALRVFHALGEAERAGAASPVADGGSGGRRADFGRFCFRRPGRDAAPLLAAAVTAPWQPQRHAMAGGSGP